MNGVDSNTYQSLEVIKKYLLHFLTKPKIFFALAGLSCDSENPSALVA